jgi:hypothetical protein
MILWHHESEALTMSGYLNIAAFAFLALAGAFAVAAQLVSEVRLGAVDFVTTPLGGGGYVTLKAASVHAVTNKAGGPGSPIVYAGSGGGPGGPEEAEKD